MVSAFHGGAFWNAVGDDFRTLDLKSPLICTVINADVLDAWFDPTPGVMDSLSRDLGWVSRTSPPTHSAGLVGALSQRLGLQRDSILVGAGSSSLIYLALGQWLSPGSRVLVPEPTYGEYAHYCAEVVKCRCDRLPLVAEEGFRLDISKWLRAVRDGAYDLAVLVNPNNPTGQVLDPRELGSALLEVPSRTRVLIDEAYLDYVGGDSLAAVASRARNVVVVKSLSKSLALSGLRVAYLVGDPASLAPLSARTPPWAVSLPAQIAAVAALGDPEYYMSRYRQTNSLREQLSCGLQKLGFETQFGAANWLLCKLPENRPSSRQFVCRAASRGLFVRDAGATAPTLADEWIRIAVKDAATQLRMLNLLAETCDM